MSASLKNVKKETKTQNIKTHRAQLDSQLEELKDDFLFIFKELRKKTPGELCPSIWVEKRASERLKITKKTESASDSLSVGVVLRVFDGETLFEKASFKLSREDLLQAVEELSAQVNEHLVLRKSKDLSWKPKGYKATSWTERLKAPLDAEIRGQIEDPKPYQWIHFGVTEKDPLWSSSEEKFSWLKAHFEKVNKFRGDVEAEYLDAGLVTSRDDFIFIDDEVALTQTLLRNRNHLVAMKSGETARIMKGGLGGQETVALSEKDYKELYSMLKKQVSAEKLKPGRYKVILGPATAGVFAHEAFGHTQEGDTWAKGRSKAKELEEKQVRVGNDHATILNNPALYENGMDGFPAWGSYYFDEEGWLAEPQVLVEKGYLKKPMTNLNASARLQVPRTANGKRQDWTRGVYTRQTNTYFSQGEKSLDELISQVDYGFLAEECAGGMEDPKGMGIQVGISYLEEIKDGKLTGRTFKGPSGGAVQMTGYVPDCLNSILDKSRINYKGDSDKDIRHPQNDVGGCGKYHKEFVNAGCGGPYMLMDQILLA